MAIVRWSPMRDMLSFQKDINRLFNDFFTSTGQGNDLTEHGWTPSVDIKETTNEIVISAELPGMKKEEVKLSIEDNTLTIRGEKKQEAEEENEKYHRIERSYGLFQRSFTLPATVDTGKVSASFQDGILRVKLPRVEEAKQKEIQIDVK